MAPQTAKKANNNKSLTNSQINNRNRFKKQNENLIKAKKTLNNKNILDILYLNINFLIF